MPTDIFENQSRGLTCPAEDAFDITPSDSTDLTQVPQGLWVGGAGNIVVITKKGTTVTLYGAAAGTVIPLRVARVKATGTTATNLRGLV